MRICKQQGLPLLCSRKNLTSLFEFYANTQVKFGFKKNSNKLEILVFVHPYLWKVIILNLIKKYLFNNTKFCRIQVFTKLICNFVVKTCRGLRKSRHMRSEVVDLFLSTQCRLPWKWSTRVRHSWVSTSLLLSSNLPRNWPSKWKYLFVILKLWTTCETVFIFKQHFSSEGRILQCRRNRRGGF